jgi:hypothetical protein
VERGSAGLSRSTRRDITWRINTSCTIPDGTASVLGVMGYAISLRTPVESGWCGVGCFRACRRLRRAPARHTQSMALRAWCVGEWWWGHGSESMVVRAWWWGYGGESRVVRAWPSEHGPESMAARSSIPPSYPPGTVSASFGLTSPHFSLRSLNFKISLSAPVCEKALTVYPVCPRPGGR